MVANAVSIPKTLAPEVADFCQRVVGVLREKMPVREVWLFGSQVTGTANRHSDVDLLVVLADEHGYRRPSLECFSVVSDVAGTRAVDVVSIDESRWNNEQASPWGFFGDIVRKGARIG